MSTVGLRERKKIQRREDIVQSAMQLFAEQGYDETTIADIAAKADVAPRTVLIYFSTKEDIAMAPVVEIAERLVLEIRERAADETSLDVFATWLREVLLNSGAGSPRMELLRQMFKKNPKLNALQSVSTADAVAEVTQAVAEDLGCREDDPAPGLVVAAMVGILTHILGSPVAENQTRLVDVAFRFLKAGAEQLRPSSDDA